MTKTSTVAKGQRGKSASRRQDIADAAIELFLEKGVAATRVEDILSSANASVGSFYHHFGDKHRLAAMVYLEHLERFQNDLLEEFERHDDTEEAVRALVICLLRWVAADPQAMKYMHQCRESSVAEFSESEETRLKQAFYGRLSQWLEERAAAGELRALPSELGLALWFGPAEQLIRAAIEPSGYAKKTGAGALAKQLAQAESVLADAAWAALRSNS